MFRHLRLGCPSHKNLFLFDTRCHIMRLYDMHSERRGTGEHFCTTLSRAWYRSLKVCECFNRRTDFCCGRHFGEANWPQAPTLHSVANMADGGTFCFRAPKRRLVVEKNAFSDLKDRYKRHIDEHVFNHAVSTESRRCFAVRDRSETQ